MRSIFGLVAILLIAQALVVSVNAEEELVKTGDQLSKVAADDVKKQQVPVPAGDSNKPAAEVKQEAEAPKDPKLVAADEEKKESDRLKEIVKEVPESSKVKDEVKEDKNTAQEETSKEESAAQSEESDEDDDDDDESSGSDEPKSSDSESKSESKSNEGDADDDDDEDDEDDSSSSSSEEDSKEKPTNIVVSNNNDLQAGGHHAAQKDQLVASEDNSVVHDKLKTNTQELPKKFNQTFLIIAIGVLAVVCFALAIALIVKRRVINANNKKELRSPRNPIYQEVTQTETA